MSNDSILTLCITAVWILGVTDLIRYHGITLWAGVSIIFVILGRGVLSQNLQQFGWYDYSNFINGFFFRLTCYLIALGLLFLDIFGFKFEVLHRLKRDSRGKEIIEK